MIENRTDRPEQSGYYYLIGVGDQKDWEEGRGHIHYIEDRNKERCIPVFTTPEGAQRHIEKNFWQTEAHLDMLESAGQDPSALTAGRFILMTVDTETLANAAASVDADYLMRDPRPGWNQEILRLRE